MYINDSYQVQLMDQLSSIAYVDYVNKLSINIRQESNFDIEDLHYNYYVEANKIFIRDQVRKVIYILKNIYRLDKRFVVYFLKKMIPEKTYTRRIN